MMNGIQCGWCLGSNDEAANGRNGSAGQQLLFNYPGLESERYLPPAADNFHLFKTRLPLCDYPAEGRIREEPRVRRQENGFCQQIKFTDNSQKKVKLALRQKNSWRGPPLPPIGPVANIIRFVRPGLFPKQCKGYMAPNNQLYGPIDVKHDCDTNSSRWKQNDGESLMQILKFFCRLVLRCTTGMEPPWRHTGELCGTNDFFLVGGGW